MELILPRIKNNKVPELALNQIQSEMKAKVEKKIEEGIYNFEEVGCPICNTNDAKLIGEKDRYGLYFSTKICTSCGLVYTNPRMTQDSYNNFYNDEYRKLYNGSEKPTTSFFDRQKTKGKKIYDFLHERNIIESDKISVLEVGCGAGGILKYFEEKGATVKGLDLGEEYINYGVKEYGLDLEAGTLSDIKLRNKPDLIIYSHILEHILDVNKEIELINKLSNENTIIYIEVPGIKEIHKNYEMNILKYFQNAHTYHFTLKSLENLMSRGGFELIHGNEFVMTAFKRTSLKPSISNDYESTIAYILKNEKKKNLFIFTKIGAVYTFKKLILLFLDKTKTRSLAKKIKSKIS